MMRELLKNSLKIAVLLFFSCSISAPVLRSSEWEIVVVDDKSMNLVYEELSVYFNIQDDDGDDDIDTIFLIDDKNGLYWELNSENWSYKYREEVKWIGTETIVMPDRSGIPRVPLRIHIRDRAGEYIESKLYLTKSAYKIDELVMPELEMSGGKLSIENYNECSVELIEGSEVVADGVITKSPVLFSELFKKERSEFGSDLSIYIFVEAENTTIKSGPWKI